MVLQQRYITHNDRLRTEETQVHRTNKITKQVRLMVQLQRTKEPRSNYRDVNRDKRNSGRDIDKNTKQKNQTNI